MTKIRALLAAVAVLAAAAAATLIGSPAYAWACSDGQCHAIDHWVNDNGYTSPIPILCGTNLNRYNVGVGQSSMALGCNDVNRIGAQPGHATRCVINGAWTTIIDNPYWASGIDWTSGYLGGPGSNTSYLCVDAQSVTVPGGGGGGGGGGGTW